MKKSLVEIKKIYASFPADIDSVAVEQGNRVQKAWHAEKLEATIAALEKARLPKSAKVLDLACGSGPLTIKLAGHFPGLFFFGCDFNEEAIAVAKKKSEKNRIKNVSFSSGPAEKLFFKNNFFSAVIALDALDHFLEPKKALAEIYRVSKKNGLLVLAVGNYFSLWPLLEIAWDKFGKGRNYLETHLTHFKSHSLKEIVQKTGFEKVSVVSLHHLRPFFGVFTKHYPKLLEKLLSSKVLGMTLFLTAKK